MLWATRRTWLASTTGRASRASRASFNSSWAFRMALAAVFEVLLRGAGGPSSLSGDEPAGQDLPGRAWSRQTAVGQAISLFTTGRQRGDAVARGGQVHRFSLAAGRPGDRHQALRLQALKLVLRLPLS